MTHPRYPLRINIGFLLNQPIGTYRDFSFDLPEVHLSADFEVTQFNGSVHISRTPQGLLVEADFTGFLIQECVRCLEDFTQSLRTHYTELFTFSFRRNVETDLIVPDDGHINLAPLTRDYLLLELPIKPICRPECRGLCPVCGMNLNETVCEHHLQVQED